MNYPVPAYLTFYVLGGSVAAIAGVLIAVRRGLKLSGWAGRERGTGSIAALLAAWFAASLIPGWLEVYHSQRIPTIQYGLLLPMAAVLAWFWSGTFLRRVVMAVPQSWMAGVQVYRVLGLIFLVLYAQGRMPGEFAWSAGVGDIAVGLLAIPAGMAYVRRPQAGAGWLRAWNLLGMTDLIVAVTLGLLTSPSPLQRLAFDRPNEWISEFPLVMIPVFLVPLSFLLHLASLWKLRQTETVEGREAMRAAGA